MMNWVSSLVWKSMWGSLFSERAGYRGKTEEDPAQSLMGCQWRAYEDLLHVRWYDCPCRYETNHCHTHYNAQEILVKGCWAVNEDEDGWQYDSSTGMKFLNNSHCAILCKTVSCNSHPSACIGALELLFWHSMFSCPGLVSPLFCQWLIFPLFSSAFSLVLD